MTFPTIRRAERIVAALAAAGAVLVLAALLAPIHASDGATITGIARTIDGDTVRVGPQRAAAKGLTR